MIVMLSVWCCLVCVVFVLDGFVLDGEDVVDVWVYFGDEFFVFGYFLELCVVFVEWCYGYDF